jgi:glycosyltransferase involved in cell wall biosynthesis
MRILWYSNAPWCASGYGTQTAIWCKRLTAAGHDVAAVAFHGLQGAPISWNGISVYPGSSEEVWALDVLPAYYQHFNADILVTLMDAWVLDPARLQGMRVAHWIPLDAAPLSSMDRRVLAGSGGTPIAMSRFGESVLTSGGFEPFYVPHGIDTNVYTPLPEDRENIRKQFGFTDRYVIGICAANQDPVRKGFPEQFAAFSVFRKQHPEALLMVHARTESRQGIELMKLAADLGITDDLRFGDQLMIAAGMISNADMTRFFNSLDVLSNCSYGEGFGLPVLEAQACGVPVVVTDFSSMPELCGSGFKVLGESYWNRGHNSWWMRPAVPQIVEAYEHAYANQTNIVREKAREFALQYDVENVLQKHWLPTLAALEDM